MAQRERADLVVRAPRILTMAESPGSLDDGCVAVIGDSIAYVGRDSSCPYSSEDVLDLRHHVLLPGLVDAHAYTGLLATVRSPSSSPVPPPALGVGRDAAYWSALFAYTMMLLSGVTSAFDSSPDVDGLERAASRSGIRLRASRLASPDDLEVLLRAGATSSPVTLYVRGGWPRLDGLEELASRALMLAVNVAELDVQDVGPLLELAPRARDLVVAGASSLPPAATRSLAEAGIGMVVVPSYALAGRWSSGLGRLASAGLRAALGTGIRSMYSVPSLLDDARLALHLDALGGFTPSPRTLLESLTVNAARVMGERLGVLAPGSKADIVALDLRKPHLMPLADDIYSALAYAASTGDFDYVIVGGRVIVEGGKHRWLYLEGIARKLAASRGAPAGFR